jgi:hypothetical protein
MGEKCPKKAFLADGTASHKTFVEAFPLLLGFRDYLIRSQGTDRLLLRIVCQSTTFGTNAELTPGTTFIPRDASPFSWRRYDHHDRAPAKRYR